MPTVQEILKQSGLSDDQIAAIDGKAVSAFSGVLTIVEQERQQAAAERERAELERRSNASFYDESIAPALNNWATEKANYDGQLSYYKSQLESARAQGHELSEPPAQARNAASGRYVTGAPGSTPGSPTYQGIEQLRSEVGGALGVLSDIQWKHQTLYGKPLPISPTELVRQAEAVKLDPATYAARTYGFAEREAELARKTQEEHDAKIRQEAETNVNRQWAEKLGSNPDVRIGQPSRFADVARAVKANERPDPVTLNESQRRQATSQAIHQDIAESGEAA